jgi:hypothetical protein
VSVEIVGGKGSSRVRPRVEVPPEVSIAFQVARELRISPKFTDDGAPEGTLERPLAIHNPQRKDALNEEVEEEDELDVYEINP